MATPGDIIEHPVTGEQIVFLKTAAETNGELLQFEMNVAPGGFIPGEHVHPYQAEYFKVLAGTVAFRIEGEGAQLGVGQELTVPARRRHTWWNASDEPATLMIEFRPALQIAEYFETYMGLAQDGHADPKTGLPNLLWLAVIFRKYGREIQSAALPAPVQAIVINLLAPVGRLLGYRVPYPYPYARARSAPAGAPDRRQDIP